MPQSGRQVASICESGRYVWPALLLAIHAGLLAWSACLQAPTIDEPFHLAAGLRRWQDNQFDVDRGNPPLTGDIAAIPVLMAGASVDWAGVHDSFAVGRNFLKANQARSFWLITLGRWAIVPLSVAGGWICFQWASELYGYASGLTAVCLWSFCPNILAFGQLITGDTTATATGISAFYALWKWHRQPSYTRALVAGLLIGLAELSKFVWVVLYPLWPVLWLILRFTNRGLQSQASWKRELLQVLTTMTCALFIVNLEYGFSTVGSPIRDFRVGQKVSALVFADNRKSGVEQSTVRSALRSAFMALPVPFPDDYVRGIDEITERTDFKPPTYLQGERRRGGWRWYYPYALCIKLPVGTIFLVLLGTVSAAFSGGNRLDWRREAFVLVPALVLICFVSSLTTSQRLRYVLPSLPFFYIWASRCALGFPQHSRAMKVSVIIALAASVASSLAVYPHSLSYFNEIIGGPRHGDAHLLDSNIDWGQDLLNLKRWLDKHSQARPLHLAYFGTTDPRIAGIEFELPPVYRSGEPDLPPGAESSAQSDDRTGPIPGWHAVSVCLIGGTTWELPNGEGGLFEAVKNAYSYWRLFEPVGRAGYSIRIYHISCEEANLVRRSLNLAELPCREESK